MLVLFPGLAQAGKAQVVPSASTDGPYLPVVELELKFVAACQTEVLCLMPSKKIRSVTKYPVLSYVEF